jgi:plastocyanin
MAWYGLLMAALFIVLAACGGDSNGTFTFSPQALNITAGTTVIWKNNTSAPHTVTGSSFGSGTINPGGSFSFKFTQAGTFAYPCKFHPYMTALEWVEAGNVHSYASLDGIMIYQPGRKYF